MSAKQGRQWRVTSGLTEKWVRDNLFKPPRQLKLTVRVIEKREGAKGFGVTIDVTDLYAGNSIIPDGNAEGWKGNFFVEGFTENYPELTGSRDTKPQLRVKVTGKIGETSELEFEVVGIK